MSESQPPPESRTMEYIPEELSREIASHLDLQSALRLARVCKALREAGEMRVYETLDMTGSWGEEAEPNPYSPLDLTTLEARLAIVTTKVDRLMVSLAASPHRVEYVSTVRLEPFDGAIGETAHQLIEVLTQVSHRVRRLDILPQPMDPARTVVGYDKTGCTLFFRFMAATTGPVLAFPRIKHLKYAYPPQAAIPVGDWLMRMSSLEEIDFCSSIGSYRISRPFVGTQVDLPNLRRISVDHQDDRLYAPNDGVLHSLLEIAPELEVLRVRGEWDPQRRDYALQSMETLHKLKTIILVDFEAAEADPSDDELMGITMSRLGMGEGDLVVEELAAKFDELDERRDGHLYDLRLPQAPALRRMTLFSSPRPSLSEYVALGLAPTPAATSHIPRRFLHQLRRTPHLASILYLYLETPFPSTYNPRPAEQAYFVDSSRWVSEGHRGCVIRSYQSPAGVQGQKDFWHVRILSRARESKRGVAYVGTQRCWRDMTEYQGRRVPRDVLQTVYRAAGMESDFDEGGRDMELGPGHAARAGALGPWGRCRTNSTRHNASTAQIHASTTSIAPSCFHPLSPHRRAVPFSILCQPHRTDILHQLPPLGSRGPSRSRHPRVRKPTRHGTARGILAYTHPVPGEAVKAGSIDQTHYQGRRVPRHVLEAVYKEAGMASSFEEGGRGLRLGDGVGAWEIFREWRGTVGDETDEEDNFVLDGTEDDDLLSDDE
ncbi:uncharacterized protein MKK02DRAFT_28614 [Dioszegia hungarica]|uniref:F-box domain-containing protein n=1 Tax=Dioszegia hungarica TaxID=4972 RepID=A0AA38H4Z6_9TREE|nr:uncharacterized protein MKK02DRAFT_28614 [Dioszegia hungarica]KAI9633860.1 hypothetical protein MKK02DRAFT_28614 [Dioszegia hungarica]